MRILHIFIDEKFIDPAFDLFDSLTGVENLYYTTLRQFTYISNQERLKQFSCSTRYKSAINDPSIDLWILHSLHPYFYKLLKHKKSSAKILCITWGYDLYATPYNLPPILKIPIYQPLTAQYVAQYDTRLSFFKRLRYLYRRLIMPEMYERIQLLSKIDYVGTVLEEEYKLLTQIDGFRAKPFPFNYPFDKDYQPHFKPHTSAQNILIGNSATTTNNHLDLIPYLSNITTRQKLILPLNYGDSDYRKHLLKELSIQLPHANEVVQAIDKFIPFDQYQKLINSCSHAIFPHLRQQALGNVYLALLQGMKLFVYKEGMIYKSLAPQGFILYTIEEDLNSQSISTPLDSDSALHNFKLASARSLVDSILKNLQVSLSSL